MLFYNDIRQSCKKKKIFKKNENLFGVVLILKCTLLYIYVCVLLYKYFFINKSYINFKFSYIKNQCILLIFFVNDLFLVIFIFYSAYYNIIL